MEQMIKNCKKVMVVDDAEIDRFMAEKIMTKYDFAEEVITVESAMDALDYLNEHKDQPENLPCLIFLDINMPEMTGFDFLDAYAKLADIIKRKCIIVMLSSSMLQEDHDLALSSPYVCDFIGKPLNPAKLSVIKASCLCDGKSIYTSSIKMQQS
ncbi:MAG: cheB 1 [Segetibacter sp.]|nr:cheB 1 [Segetibacter sp.]